MADNTAASPSRLLEYLPSIYREDPTLGHFLLAFEKVLLGREDKDGDWTNNEKLRELRGLEEVIAGLANFFDPNPDKTPKEFLPWLAGWVAFSLRADVDEKKQREFIANMIELYRWRGTKQNLITLFKIFTNREPTVTEPSDEANPHYFIVLLNLSDLVIGKEQQEVDRQMEIAHALIRLEKPAHTRYKLEPIFPTFRIGSQAQGTEYYTQVGKNTRLGIAMWEK
jgi:phage tail-like protein